MVDNGSTDNIESVAKEFKEAIFLKEERPGSYAARNEGIKHARGDIIAFTDSDCLPKEDWIEKGVSKFMSHKNCGLLAGEIENIFVNQYKPTAIELYDSIMHKRVRHNLECKRFGVTANLFTSRQTIDKVGLFDGTLKSSGDKEWGNRVSAAGYFQAYGQDVTVGHVAVNSLYKLCRKKKRMAGGVRDIRKLHSSIHNKETLKQYLDTMLYPFRSILYIWSNNKLNGYLDKIKVSLVFILFLPYEVIEKIGLALGGRSSRG